MGRNHTWTAEEEARLIEAMDRKETPTTIFKGNKFPGLTYNQIKNKHDKIKRDRKDEDQVVEQSLSFK